MRKLVAGFFILASTASCSQTSRDNPEARNSSGAGTTDVSATADGVKSACLEGSGGMRISDVFESPESRGFAIVSEDTPEGAIVRLSKADPLTQRTVEQSYEFRYVDARKEPAECGPRVLRIGRGLIQGNIATPAQASEILAIFAAHSARAQKHDSQVAAARNTPASTPAGVPQGQGDMQVGDCKGQWIYTPKDWDADVGLTVWITPNGKYQAQASDYGNQDGTWSVNGRPGEDRIILDGYGSVQNCQGRNAELTLSDSPDRVYRVTRYSGDPFAEWQKHGFQPD